MPTSVRAVTASIAPRIASPGGGLRSSVSTSIKSSPVRMISIGPEGGRARVDTSFSPNPFTRMRPVNPNLNPGGKIFGENGSARSKTAESAFGPKMGEIRFNRPAPRVGYTPEAASKADMGLAFAKARARNQAQVAARKAGEAKIANSFIASALSGINPEKSSNPPIRQSADPLNTSIDFKGFQSTPKAKELAHVTTTKEKILKHFDMLSALRVQNDRGVVESPRLNPQEIAKKAIRPQVRLNIQELSAAVARLRTARNSQSELSQQVTAAVEANKQATLRASRLVEVLKARKTSPGEIAIRSRIVRTAQLFEITTKPQVETSQRFESPKKAEVPALPKLTVENVQSFKALQPLVDQGIMTEDQAMQRAGVIRAPRVESSKATQAASKATLPQVDGISPKQAEALAAVSPLIQEENDTVRNQILATTGVNPEAAKQFIQKLGQARPSIEIVEQSPQTREQVALQQAVQIVSLPELGVISADESEAEIKKKAQSLITVIRQTYQLNALGNTEADTTQLVERQLAASEAIPQRLLVRVSSLLVRMVRQITADPAEDPSKKALHQVDLEKQNKRVKLVSKSIDMAPRNDQGEIARDFVIGQIQENNNQNYWGRLAIILKQNFDGSLDEMVVRLKKLKFWESTQTVAKTIDDSMAEYPAVEPTFKQTTKEVGRKEVGKTMDPMWAEMIKSLIKTLVITPQPAPTIS